MPTCPPPAAHPPCAQPNVKLLIDGQFVESKSSQWIDVTNPVRPRRAWAGLPRVHAQRVSALNALTTHQHLSDHVPAQATQDVISRLPETTPAEFEAAVAAAKAAFPKWRDTPVSVRARAMFKFQELINAHKDELALSVTMEQGKTIADAHGDVFRGLGAPPPAWCS